jgi:hypothetical protein
MNPTLLSLQQPSLASNAPQGSSAVPLPKRPNLHPPDQERHLNVEVFTSIIKQGILVDDNSDTDSDANNILSEPPLDDCEPPMTRAPRGRPPKKRKRNGENDGRRKKGKDQAVQRAPVRCSTCRGGGHNASNYTRSHT